MSEAPLRSSPSGGTGHNDSDALPDYAEAAMRLLRPGEASAEVPSLSGLLSASAVVGVWSAATGGRTLMRALNAAHEIEERRPVATGAALAVLLWTASPLAFGLAVSTVLDYGATCGSLGTAAALLIYRSTGVLLLGAEVSAV